MRSCRDVLDVHHARRDALWVEPAKQVSPVTVGEEVSDLHRRKRRAAQAAAAPLGGDPDAAIEGGSPPWGGRSPRPLQGEASLSESLSMGDGFRASGLSPRTI